MVKTVARPIGLVVWGSSFQTYRWRSLSRSPFFTKFHICSCSNLVAARSVASRSSVWSASRPWLTADAMHNVQRERSRAISGDGRAIGKDRRGRGDMSPIGRFTYYFLVGRPGRPPFIALDTVCVHTMVYILHMHHKLTPRSRISTSTRYTLMSSASRRC